MDRKINWRLVIVFLWKNPRCGDQELSEMMKRGPLGIKGIGVITLGLIVANSGCALLLLGAGIGGGVGGTAYFMGKLEKQVDAPVPTVRRATVAGLKNLDLPVIKDKGDKLAAEIESESADGKRIWITVKTISKSRSEIKIRVGYMGDQARSQRILENIKPHL